MSAAQEQVHPAAKQEMLVRGSLKHHQVKAKKSSSTPGPGRKGPQHITHGAREFSCEACTLDPAGHLTALSLVPQEELRADRTELGQMGS